MIRTFAFVVVLSSGSAAADSWYIPEEAVTLQAMEAYAQEYEDRTGYLMPNGLAGIHYDEHLCLELVRMTGGYVELDDDHEWDLPDYPSASEIETDDLIYLYSTLDSWLKAVYVSLEMNRFDRETYLESECD